MDKDSAACHRGSGDTGLLGAPSTDCDSPLSLINATFQWIDDNLKDKIDFVVWTGDSARHDSDDKIPRNEKQVVSANELLVNKFVEVFGKGDDVDDPDPTKDMTIPVIPTFGNNDILPHNIFTPGPNQWTRTFARIWNKFIPEEQRHSFERGGWFSVEVIPNKLAVFSLNTLYFFESNTVVNGCDKKSEAGYEHMKWLRIQLQLLRERGMKAIMTGHVPPARTNSKQDWNESCWQKYALWLRQYRDVVIAGLWGHMNIDHFMFQDANEVRALEELEDFGSPRQEGEFSIESKTRDYLQELHEKWMNLPSPPSGMSYVNVNESDDNEDGNNLKKHRNKDKKKKKKKAKDDFLEEIGGKWAERFSLSLVSPSVVPNYYPTLRVIEYNITGLDVKSLSLSAAAAGVDYQDSPYTNLERCSISSTQNDTEANKKRKKKKKKHPKVPPPPSKSSPPGPAHSPQTLSLLSYTQYYANLTTINAELTNLTRSSSSSSSSPRLDPELVRDIFTFEVEYDTRNYSAKHQLHDLTVRSLLDLAVGIAKGRSATSISSSSLSVLEVSTAEDDETVETEKKKKGKGHKKKKKKKKKQGEKNELWYLFLKRVFVGTKDREELEEDFS